MCRVVIYQGKPILIKNLLFSPENALIKQSYSPKMMSVIQNLAGFGMTIWNSKQLQSTLTYRSTQLPFYDKNLYSLSNSLTAETLLAHVRGTRYLGNFSAEDANLHPFQFENSPLFLAHNGNLAQFSEMKHDLFKEIHPEFYKHIQGTTDTEWIYAVFLTRVYHHKNNMTIENLVNSVFECFDIIQKIRKKNLIKIASPLNLYITNGQTIIVTRFVLDYGYFPSDLSQEHFTYHSLWYCLGDEFSRVNDDFQMTGFEKKSSIIIASEPLSKDNSSWIEIPEYSLLAITKTNEKINIKFYDVDVE